MLRYAVLRAALWCASLAGVALFAAAVAALGMSGADNDWAGYFGAVRLALSGVPGLEFGLSTVLGVPSLAAAAPALLASLELLLVSLFVAIAVGGVLGAALAGKATQWAVGPAMQLAGSVPIFCVALLLVVVVGPGTQEALPLGPVLFPALAHGAVLPALQAMMPLLFVVGLAGAGVVARSVSSALEIARAEPYSEGLVRLGLSQREVLRVFVARQVLALTVKDAGDILLALFAASAVVEWIFAWPGAGAHFIRSVALQDWAVVAVFICVIGFVRFTADLAGALASRALLGQEPPP